MNIKAVSTNKSSVSEAAADIKRQLAGFQVKMMVYFASYEAYDAAAISAEMQSAFAGAVVYGCSSHAEMLGGKTSLGTVTAMAFNSEAITDAKVEVLENLSGGIDVSSAFRSFDAHFNTSMADADYRKYGGMVLIDGASFKEEEVMDKIGSRTNIMFVGGSASDNLAFKKTYIYANGKAYPNAALLAIFKTKNGIDYIKTQSVDVTDISLTVTKANGRAIIEYDNQPAAIRYAEVIGVKPEEVQPMLFANPVGLVIDSDVYLRACPIIDGTTMVYYCSMMEGMEVKLCKIRNIIPDIKAAVQNKV